MGGTACGVAAVCHRRRRATPCRHPLHAPGPPGFPIALPGAANREADPGDGSGDASGGGAGAPSPLLCIKRTWQPNVRKRKKTHGFLVR
jgi:hypothetical protein